MVVWNSLEKDEVARGEGSDQLAMDDKIVLLSYYVKALRKHMGNGTGRTAVFSR